MPISTQSPIQVQSKTADSFEMKQANIYSLYEEVEDARERYFNIVIMVDCSRSGSVQCQEKISIERAATEALYDTQVSGKLGDVINAMIDSVIRSHFGIEG